MKAKTFNTEVLEVKWSHLHAPDDKFGADSSNHNITVIVDDALKNTLEEVQSQMNAAKINGMKIDDEGVTMLKVKSKAYTKNGTHTFPCRDGNAARTEAVPFGGDKVILRLSPAVLSRDNSLSLYLNGVQIIEKNDRDDGGFEPQDNSFDGSSYKKPEQAATSESEEEVPF